MAVRIVDCASAFPTFVFSVCECEGSAAGAEEPGRKTFMVERMQMVEGANCVAACQKMLGKLAHARSEFSFEGTKRDRSAWSDQPVTPVSSAKRVRRLSASPTDASLPDDLRNTSGNDA